MPLNTCTLAITPLVKELMCELAGHNQHYTLNSKTARLAQVLFDQLIEMPVQPLDFVLSKNEVIQTMSDQLINKPNNRKTLPQYTMPKRLFALPSMPLNINGKVDRLKVKQIINENILKKSSS